MATNSSPQGEGVNKIVPLGGTRPSSNASLGIEKRIEKGTVGSRPDMGAGKYGGDDDSGVLFKGNSVARDDKQLNSGGGESATNNANQLGSSEYIKGGVGSRENMPKYGKEQNSGKLMGLGAGSTKDISPTDQLQRDLPAYPGLSIVDGTANAKANLAKAKGGIGKPGAGGARM